MHRLNVTYYQELVPYDSYWFFHMMCCVDETFMSVDTDDFSWCLKIINVFSAFTSTFCVVLTFAYLGLQIGGASEVEVNEKKYCLRDYVECH